MSTKTKKILWYNLAFMAFSTVWGFGNVINGFSYYGMSAVGAWILIFALYFIPYTLMVGELGSVFKNEGGGVSSWIKHTLGPALAYYAGWTYWIVHMPYISQKPSGVLISASWAIFQGPNVSSMNPTIYQGICLLIFIAGLWIAAKGINPLKHLTTIAGTAMFIMSILFIIMMIAAPAITGGSFNSIDFSFNNLFPKLDSSFFLSLSILVFAVGGCEKIAPYVNKMDKPERNFPKGMIALAIMVAICAILGTFALGMMIDPNNIPQDLLTNGSYYAFQSLGEYYHVGNLFMIIYAVCNFVAQLSTLILSIDAPLRSLLDSGDTDYMPSKLFVKNDNGAYVNGIKLVGCIVSILIIIPAFGIGSVDEIVRWLVKLNSVCMPLRYLWVFVAYIALKRLGDKFQSEYQFTKNKTIGIIIGVWCFALTAFACVLGIYSTDTFQLTLNIITPFVLVGLGVIMPILAKKEKNKQ